MRFLNKKRLTSLVAIILIGGLIFGGVCYALSRFHGKKQQCLNSSGGRSSISAVQYACDRASTTSKNGCSLWIGSASAHGLPVIYAESTTAIVPAAFWGMCTDYRDTTRNITVERDNNSIDDSMTLTRGVWGAPTSVPTTLNVAKFISGATKSTANCYIQYKRTVRIWRTNGESGDRSYMDEVITVRIPTNKNACTTEKNLCKLWNSNYSSSSSTTNTSGSTSIIVKARNTASRFNGMGSGAWSHGNEIVYAMPTDNVQWHSCYYPGVQKTVDTLVSDINGSFTNGGTGGNQYMTLPNSYCMTYQPTVGYTKLRPGYDAKIGIWQNQYKVGTGITSVGPLSFPIGNSQVRESSGNRDMGTSVGGDVGNMLEQKGITGKPISASVGSNTPSVGVYKCPCCPNPPKQNCTTVNGVAACVDVPCTETNTCYCCTNSYSNAIRSASVNDGPTSDSAYVVVPYNFVNDITVEVPEQDVFAGEGNVKVNKVTAYVNTRYNYTTIADYATVVPNSKVKLFMYVHDDSDGGGGGMVQKDGNCDALDAKQCVEVDSDNLGTLNSGGSLSGDSKDWFSSPRIYNAFDAAAGDYLCFVAALWPYSSGSDTNRDPSGDNMWKYSEPSCNIIAKRPSFQVWGGSMYGFGSVNAWAGKKRNIYNGYFSDVSDLCKGSGASKYCFKPKGSGNKEVTFGSWVEEGLVLGNGQTTTIASGAATGLNGATVAKTGSTGASFCKDRSPLTFANYSATNPGPCNGTEWTGASKISSGITNGNREELIDYWLGSSGGTVNMGSGTLNLANIGSTGAEVKSATGAKIRYIHASGNLTLHGGVPQGATYLIKSNDTVTIDSNIAYNGGTYSSLGSIPKVIIYAKHVKIKCNVTRVDAIIVTASGGSVDTCSDAPEDESAPQRSKRLEIFGAVITDSITLGRTYGSAAWDSSKYSEPTDGKAAEVFNYDTSVFLWSEYMSGSAETDTLQTVYQHELAPRY